jgi:predicted nucleic acid-binding protein
LYIVERQRGLQDALSILGLIKQLPISLIEVTNEQVLEAAHIKANHPLAYADAFAVAAALDKGAKLVTGDPEFQAVKELVELSWISK